MLSRPHAVSFMAGPASSSLRCSMRDAEQAVWHTEWGEVDALPSLQWLSLDNNALTGSLDAVGPGCPQLAFLLLDNNSFASTLPAMWTQQMPLQMLELSDNAHLTGTHAHSPIFHPPAGVHQHIGLLQGHCQPHSRLTPSGTLSWTALASRCASAAALRLMT